MKYNTLLQFLELTASSDSQSSIWLKCESLYSHKSIDLKHMLRKVFNHLRNHLFPADASTLRFWLDFDSLLTFQLPTLHMEMTFLDQ